MLAVADSINEIGVPVKPPAYEQGGQGEWKEPPRPLLPLVYPPGPRTPRFFHRLPGHAARTEAWMEGV